MHPLTLTVGQVAGIINAAIVVAHLTFPLIMVFIVVGILQDRNNAVTWSVLGGLLNSSKWPRLLSTDSATKRKVSKRVLIPSMISSLGLLFLGIVSSITPLGLSSSVEPSSAQAAEFQYAPDTSPIGAATTSHQVYTTNRLCGYDSRINCPGSEAGYGTFENSTGWYGIPITPDAYISSAIASNITEAFTSATSGDGNTISSVFDIEYRNFIYYNNATQPGPNGSLPWIDQGRPRVQGEFQYYQSLVLENRYFAVEGAVLDLISGGIGFRNHTLPPSLDTGYQWEEDLLWIEPDTTCVNLNVTVDYAIEPSGGGLNARLTDRGGLATDLPNDYPVVDLSNTQENPALYDRAWVGAVLTNYNFMIYFNDTRDDLFVGKTYSLEGNGLATESLRPNQFSIVQYGDNSLGPVLPQPLVLTDLSNSTISDNGTQKYMDIDIVTQGFGPVDNANITNIMATTGLILGAGVEVDASGNPILGQTSVRIDPLTNWSQPLYSCASALKASVKRVSFQMNGTASISNLVINSIAPVVYSSNSSKPLWAVENTGLNIEDVTPFWGLISSEYSSSPSLYTLQKEFLYLPAGMGAIAGLSDGYGAAGAMAPAGALNELYNDITPGGSTDLPDFSGKTNYPMFLKWRDLSSNASTASTIPNLIWTDIMANAVLGSKSQLSRNGTAPLSSALVTTTPFRTVIEYNYLYAIPAFCFLCLYVLMLLISLILFLTRRARLSTLRLLLNQTAAGRAVTFERHGHRIPPQAPTTQWVDMFGDEEIKVKKSMADQKYESAAPEAPYSPYQQQYHDAVDMKNMPSASQVRLNPALAD